MQPENEYVVYTEDEHVTQISLDFCRHFAGIKANIAHISCEIPNYNYKRGGFIFQKPILCTNFKTYI